MSYTGHPSLGAESAVGGISDRPAFFSAFESPRTASVPVNAPCRDIIIPSYLRVFYSFLLWLTREVQNYIIWCSPDAKHCNCSPEGLHNKPDAKNAGALWCRTDFQELTDWVYLIPMTSPRTHTSKLGAKDAAVALFPNLQITTLLIQGCGLLMVERMGWIERKLETYYTADRASPT